MDLTQELKYLASKHPHLKGHVDKILTATRSKTASSGIESLMGGSSIFSVKTVLAKRIDRVLKLYELDPFAATVSLKGSDPRLLISAKCKEEMSDFAVDYIAREIAKDLTLMGYRVEGSGFFSTFTGSAQITITQKGRS